MSANPPAPAADNEIVITRVFDAPRELVWEAMTNPKHVVNWWGPNGFTTTTEIMDVRVGGVWKHVMVGPDGTKYPNKSIFKELVKPEKIVYSHGGGREDGNAPGATFTATWRLEEVAVGKTRLTARMVFPTAEQRNIVVKEYGAIEGGKQTMGRLAEYLPKMAANSGEFVLTRTFDAPRDLVWQAWTERECLLQWFGPKGCIISTAKLDFRPGGLFHYGMKTPDGKEVWGKFIYREIVAPEKIVMINSFSDEQGGVTRHPMSASWPLEMLSTSLFSEHDGRTLLTLKWSPHNATAEERAAFDAARPNMAQGWSGTLEQLTEYLAKTKS